MVFLCAISQYYGIFRFPLWRINRKTDVRRAWTEINRPPQRYCSRSTMSLFKVRDCWSTVCGRGETFGCDALVVDDLFDAGEDNVILGSLNGVLRIYGVHAGPAPDLRYTPSDLLVEAQKESPILQVCTGKLIRSVLNEILKNKTPTRIYLGKF